MNERDLPKQASAITRINRQLKAQKVPFQLVRGRGYYYLRMLEGAPILPASSIYTHFIGARGDMPDTYRSESKMLSFKSTRAECVLITAIAKRAVALAADAGIEYDMMTAHMDVSACHANGSPLDLDALANADDATFGHDVFGIRRHIDRRTGKLGDCFLPRTAKPEPRVMIVGRYHLYIGALAFMLLACLAGIYFVVWMAVQ